MQFVRLEAPHTNISKQTWIQRENKNIYLTTLLTLQSKGIGIVYLFIRR